MSSTIEVHLTRAEARAGVTRTVLTDEHEFTFEIPARIKDDTTFQLAEGLYLRVRVAKSRAKRPLLIGAGVLTALMAFAIVISAINNSTPGGPVPPAATSTSASASALATIGQCVKDTGVRIDLTPVPCGADTLEVLDVVSGVTRGKACELSKATTHTAESSRPPFKTYCLKKN
ncbi:hypothetical protein SAMN05421504_1011119 [Amycolatopsis xylanica]|uniref:Uncharacterized protein n=1 Tax=Amycolatopsis xylanica TaxID=589385 RepID=A0A1H2V5V6_9PSEU|nr:hypothetical protein [Amycolatopsis xylanica]SDW63640.1 hypothetical protein SAMN05421504_1011119 [Amycolatopsis xylanica]